MKKNAIALCIAGFCAPLFAQTVDPCTQTTKLSTSASGVQTYTNNSEGNKPLPSSTYGYEMWTEGGNNNKLTWFGPNQGGGAAFKAEWNNPNDFLGRVGYFWNEGRPYTSYKNVYCDFNFTRSADGTGGSYSYIGIYGWTKNKLVEWYIVDDWFGTGIMGPSTMGGGATKKGEFTVDGATYFIYQGTRDQKPSIEGTQTFPQYFSIRQTRRKCGTISVTEHFKKWEELGLTLGTNIYEAKFLVEAGGGTGSFEASYLKLTQEETPRGLPDGNFVLSTDVNPATSGEITRSPNASYYPTSTSVTLTAKAADGWEFDGWSGDLSGKTSPATITIDANKSVIANFVLKVGELVKNGKFNASSNNGLGDPNTEWKLNTWGNSQASASSSNGAVTININTLPTTGNKYDLQLVQAGIPLLKGNKYILTFEAKAASDRTINVVLQMPDDPWTDFLRDTSVALTTTMQTFEYEFNMTANDFPNARLGFDFGNSTAAVTIGNVSLTYVGAGTTTSSSSTVAASSSSSDGSSSSSAKSSSSSSLNENSPIRLISNISKSEFSVSSLSNKSLLVETNSPTVVEIYDLKGNKAMAFNTLSGLQTINLSLPHGVYFAKARGKQAVRFVLK
ncbi:MAG: glycoside hydrolase family 11 protein [Candidatus Fibromonas sp.]|jgi:hypothetical protein|nr:glycoside hydrolase family 11 protein [Candidatus Fibromonas sp.]